MSLPTLDDLKVFLNKTSTADDDELVNKLDAAVEVVEGLIGPIRPVTVSETHRGLSAGSLLLRRYPATAVTAVSVRTYSGTAPITPNVADYELDPDGTVRLASGYWHYGDVTVTYTVGRDVSASIAEAVLIVAGHLWETQRGTSPSALSLQGEDVGPAPGLGYAIPNRARDLLAAHARPALA